MVGLKAIANVEKIVAQATGAIVDGGAVSGDTIEVTNYGSGTARLNVTADAAGATVNLTNFTFSGANTGVIINGGIGVDIITGTTATDTITGGTGIDNLTGGTGDDIFILTGSAQAVSGNAAIDLIDGGVGTADEIRLSTATTIAAADILTRITNVEKITSDANAGIVSVTITAASATGTAFTSIDLSGDTNATSANVISVTGITTIAAITGSVGVDTITLGAAAIAATVTGGLGADIIALTTANAATVVVATADTGATYANADKITGFTTLTDKLSLGVAATNLNFATANAAADFAAAVTAANNAMDNTIKYYLATAIGADLGGGAGAESLLFIDTDLDGTFNTVIALVGTAGVVVVADIIV
jgi:hypothetical protein